MSRYRKTFRDKFWHDKDGDFVVWQSPNMWLMVWFVLFVLSEFIRNDVTRFLTSWVGFGAILVWAALEASSGVNYFRRMLGWLVLIFAILVKF
jgi:hypothetical protein